MTRATSIFMLIGPLQHGPISIRYVFPIRIHTHTYTHPLLLLLRLRTWISVLAVSILFAAAKIRNVGASFRLQHDPSLGASHLMTLRKSLGLKTRTGEESH